jgi:isoquinoline 1-oxidoreductase beta subunit
MGQGSRTALAMIIADELGADWESVKVVQANAAPEYGNQLTGGSTGISDNFMLFRKAGAVARMMLIAAAAQRWDVPEESCRAESGVVIHEASGERLTFADLVEAAGALPTPKVTDIKYKDPLDFKIIGSNVSRVDNPQLVDGSAIYGIDISIPGMLYAVLARSPVSRGRLSSFDANQAVAVEGVRDVVQISNGVAVVAETTWAAMKGRDALVLTWDEGHNADLGTDDLRQSLTERATPDGWSGESEDPDILAAVYEVPYLAHATQEPMNCVADVREDGCEVWAPTQNPSDALQRAGRIANLPADAVTVHVPLIGGGFGRRLEVDYVAEAVEISKAVGAPIKLVWTREDDIQHDFYHPFSINYIRGRLDRPSLPQITSETAGQIPTGAWRAVTNFTEAFVRESFIDEMAVALERDPLELRLDLEPQTLKAVLERVGSESDWGSPLPDGWGRGIACHSTWNVSPVAEVAEVSVSEDGIVRVHRVVCAIDCGLVINPDMVKAQMEGGIVFALTAALKSSITIENGRVQQSNFHDYPLLRIDEMPEIEVHILENESLPFGVGEMAGPPVAPAVFNAVYAVTGKRIRHLPIRKEELL